MVIEQPTVFLIDDDPVIRKVLTRGLRRRGLKIEAFQSAHEFLNTYSPEQRGCLILDLSMPEMDGLELQQELINRNFTIPIIFITGNGGILQSVQALKAGAIDFLEKPFLPETLASSIADALAHDQEIRSEKYNIALIQARFDLLTNREQEVCQLLLDNEVNLSSKEMASKLSISHRTVEQHRSRVLEKIGVKSTFELQSLAALIGLTPSNVD